MAADSLAQLKANGFLVQPLSVGRADFRDAVLTELRARGFSATGAETAFGEREHDYWRCYRNNFTAARSVTAVIGSWSQPTSRE
jgi:hypothetical protein